MTMHRSSLRTRTGGATTTSSWFAARAQQRCAARTRGSTFARPPAVRAHRDLDDVEPGKRLVRVEEARHGVQVPTAGGVLHGDDRAVRGGQRDEIRLGHGPGPLEELGLRLEERALACC